MPVTRQGSQDIRDGDLTDVDIATANKDGIAGTPSMRTLGTGSQQATAGDDSRLSDDRTADGIRTATTVVDVASAAAPTTGQVLVATSGTAAEWQTASAGLTESNFVDNEEPSGTINGVNDTFTLANTPTAGTEHLYKNGIRMRPGGSDDYTISGATITFVSAQIPVTGDVLICDYRIP